METNFQKPLVGDVKIRERKCPSCSTELKRFAITSLHSPVEQWRMPIFDSIAKDNNFAGITFGQMSLEEFFVFCFRATCKECGHISLWQIKQEEVNIIIQSGAEGYAIEWVYAYEELKAVYDKMQAHGGIASSYVDRIVEIINLLYPEKAIANAR